MGVESIDNRFEQGRQAGARPRVLRVFRVAALRAQEDRRLLVRYHRDGDIAAREQLVQRFLPLARQLARRYQRGGEPLDDLVQVASLGLLKAIDRFDPARETAFSSFAVPTILGEIKRHFRDKGWAVRVPRDLQELVGQGRPRGRRDGARARPCADADGDRAAHRDVARAGAGGARGVRRVPRGLARPPAHRRGGGRRLLRRRGRRRGSRLPRRRGRRDRRPADARAHRPRARGAAAAVRGGPDAVGDRDPRRGVADARLTADPPVDRAPPRRGGPRREAVCVDARCITLDHSLAAKARELRHRRPSAAARHRDDAVPEAPSASACRARPSAAGDGGSRGAGARRPGAGR